MGFEAWSSNECGGLENAIKNKTARKLKAGESVNTWLTAVVYPSEGEVAQLTKEGKATFK
jgi:hypothetical protein